MSLHRPITVRPLDQFRLWVEFADGVTGEVDLSDTVGKGIFTVLSDPQRFHQVTVGDSGELLWPGGLDVCSDAIYRELQSRQSAVSEGWPRSAYA